MKAKTELRPTTITFGIGGHIPTIERILARWNNNEIGHDFTYRKHVWDEIGREIGWCPMTAALHYFKHLSKVSSSEPNKH